MTTTNAAPSTSSVNTQKRFRIITVVAVVAFIIVFGLAGYLAVRNIAQVETFKARVAGHVVTVSSPGNGRLVSMPLEVGDYVARDEELAQMEVYPTAGGVAPGARVLIPIRAPLSGVVLTVSAVEGDVRTSGQPLFSIVDPEDLWIEANIHETRIGRVKVGQPARVGIRALRLSFPGRVESINPATTSALSGAPGATGAVEVPVRIAVDTRGYSLYPGMSVEVRIQLEPRLW